MESLRTHRGFTLVELLVVVSIMMTMTGVVFTSQGTFNKSTILANTAYDIALSIRSAQTYGLGGKALGQATNVGYGVRFDPALPTQFLFFADTYPVAGVSTACHTTSDPNSLDAQAGNCSYDSGAGKDALISTYALGNGSKIRAVYTHSLGVWSTVASNVDITFARPNPDVFVSVNGTYSSQIDKVCIAISTADGSAFRYVSVSASGTIAASATSCI